MKIKFVSEYIGTLFLLTIVIGSGIMGNKLSEGNMAIALLANSLATGLGLSVLILIFAPVSGAHFNPIVSIIDFVDGKISKKEFTLYIIAQLAGAISGVFVAHLMFGERLISYSSHDRSGWALFFSEFVATFGLIMVIKRLSRTNANRIPFAVGAYIASAYWFTSSTSFANPTVTIARAFTSSFAGIHFGSVCGFIVAQFLGAVGADIVFRWFDKIAEVKK